MVRPSLRDVLSNPLVLLCAEVLFFVCVVWALSGCVAPQCCTPTQAEPRGPVVSAPRIVDVTVQGATGAGGQVAVVTYAGGIEDGSTQVLRAAFESLPPGLSAIVLVLDSPGGVLHEARGMARVVETAPAPVACVADGLAASAAFYLLQACPLRAMTERSQLLVHEAYGSRSGRSGTRELESELEAMRSVNQAMAAHQCRRLTMTLAECQARYAQRDWWVLPAEALEVGAVDLVVPTPSALVVLLVE